MEEMDQLHESLKKKLLLYVITDPQLSRGRTHPEIAKKALSGGATAVQLRDKTLSTRELLEVGRELRRLTRLYGALFIVNDRVDVALALDADGVHVGDEDLPPRDCRRLLGKDKIIGVSAGTPAEAREAEAAGANYLGSGPVFATSTKQDTGPELGFAGLSEICHAVSIPVIGIGGLDWNNMMEIEETGACGVAVVSAVVSAADPEEVCRRFRKSLKGFE